MKTKIELSFQTCGGGQLAVPAVGSAAILATNSFEDNTLGAPR